jgi:hypothetical protein
VVSVTLLDLGIETGRWEEMPWLLVFVALDLWVETGKREETLGLLDG